MPHPEFELHLLLWPVDRAIGNRKHLNLLVLLVVVLLTPNIAKT